MAADSRRIQVCINCRSRKKKCDKRLPSCGYCIQKELACSYGGPSPRVTQKPSPRDVAAGPDTELVDPSSRAASYAWSAIPTEPGFMQTSLYVHVNGLIRSTGQFVDDISARYFKGIHRFTPTIARARFHDELITLGATPAADLSVLLLCMCLVAPDPESTSDSASVRKLYLAARSIFAQLQGVLATSVHLIQAGILLAICEYIQDESDTALATLASCVRMAYAARIHHRALPLEPGADARAQVEGLEARNTWWSVAIWERIVMLEVTETGQPLLALLPGKDALLPSETEFLDHHYHEHFEQMPSHLICTPLVVEVGSFARTAQAAMFADSTHQAFGICDATARTDRLNSISNEIQSFLGILISQSDGKPAVYCGAFSIAIRSLFSLHEHILRAQSKEAVGRYREARRSNAAISLAALSTATKLTIDVAEWHEKVHPHSTGTLTPNYAHMATAALRQLENGLLEEDKAWLSTVEAQLRDSLSRFNRLWGKTG